ncbi:MAG: antitoxin [Promethearchaeota archaeon]|nr:MAG: antitoxin [Candidatus Lokiarchaeota archaeon]
MGHKTVSLSEEAYNALKSIKKEGETFNDLILRLVQKPDQKEILSLAGTWQGSDEEAEKILEIIYENREKTKSSRVIL